MFLKRLEMGKRYKLKQHNNKMLQIFSFARETNTVFYSNRFARLISGEYVGG